MNLSTYPQLYHLMNSYFHQDYDLNGDNDLEILHEFARYSSPEGVSDALAEIDLFLATQTCGLNDRFRQETGMWNMLIGDDDVQARDWLIMARQVLSAWLINLRH